MSNFKGTKGNWDYAKSSLNPKKHNFGIIGGDGSIVADIYKKKIWDGKTNTEAPEISEANAKLIAAAPEMLEHLQYAVKALKSISSFGATTPIIDRLESVIKKATE